MGGGGPHLPESVFKFSNWTIIKGDVANCNWSCLSPFPFDHFREHSIFVNFMDSQICAKLSASQI